MIPPPRGFSGGGPGWKPGCPRRGLPGGAGAGPGRSVAGCSAGTEGGPARLCPLTSSFGYSDTADVCPRDTLRYWRSFLIDFIRALFSLPPFPLKVFSSRTPYPKCIYVYIRIRIFIFIVDTVHPFMQRVLLMLSGSGQETPPSEPRCARSRCIDTNPAARFC